MTIGVLHLTFSEMWLFDCAICAHSV